MTWPLDNILITWFARFLAESFIKMNDCGNMDLGFSLIRALPNRFSGQQSPWIRGRTPRTQVFVSFFQPGSSIQQVELRATKGENRVFLE